MREIQLRLGLSGLSKIANETGGECFSLSTSNLVSFKPYLDRLQKLLNNQYYLVFNPIQGKKDSLQRINIQPQPRTQKSSPPTTCGCRALRRRRIPKLGSRAIEQADQEKKTIRIGGNHANRFEPHS
jgi:hypothetical protein